MASGYGFFIQMMKDEGFMVEGIEISEERLKICNERIPESTVHVFNLNMEDAPDDLSDKFHLVTMFHLLEHLTDPVLFLKRLRKIIMKDGYLVVELPNVCNLMMKASPDLMIFSILGTMLLTTHLICLLQYLKNPDMKL